MPDPTSVKPELKFLFYQAIVIYIFISPTIVLARPGRTSCSNIVVPSCTCVVLAGLAVLFII